MANEDIKEEESGSSDEDDILQMRAKLTPSLKEEASVGSLTVQVPEVPEIASSDPSQGNLTVSSRTSSLAAKKGRGAFSPTSSEASPVYQGQSSKEGIDSPARIPPSRFNARPDLGEEDLCDSPQAGGSEDPLASRKKMRVSDGVLDVKLPLKPIKSKRMSCQDGDILSPNNQLGSRAGSSSARRMGSETNVSLGPSRMGSEVGSEAKVSLRPSRTGNEEFSAGSPMRRQSDYNMIFSFEKHSVVQSVIQRMLANKYEVAYQLTGIGV